MILQFSERFGSQIRLTLNFVDRFPRNFLLYRNAGDYQKIKIKKAFWKASVISHIFHPKIR